MSSNSGTWLGVVRLGVLAVVGLVFLVGGLLAGDWARVGGGTGVLVLVGFFVVVAQASDRARREPGSPWGRSDTVIVVVGAVVATAALAAAVVDIIK